MKLRLLVVVFFAFGLASLASALAISAAFSFSLERGFDDFLLAYDKQRFAGLVERLEAQGEALDRDDVTLEELTPSFRAFDEIMKRLLRTETPNLQALPGHAPPEDFEFRLAAFNEAGEQIFGPSPSEHALLSQRIISDDIIVRKQKIGELMVLPRGKTPSGVSSRFLTNQYRAGGLFLALVLFLNLIPAWFIARNADRVVRGVEEATADIVSGRYSKRAPDSPIEEISKITTNINLLADDLQRLADLRRIWLAETSHELRTPLAAMTAEVSALADGLRTYSPRAILSLQEEANNLGRLVNDLHFLAVADLTAPSCSPAVLDPVVLCGNIVDRFRARVENAGLELVFEVRVNSPSKAAWDKGRIEQVFSNILTNSLRYTDAPGKIAIAMHEKAGSIVLTFEDTSPSVAPADLEKLFEPLFRAGATRDRAKGGAGLGLSVTQTIIRMHSGSIDADASPLGGLRLTVILPRSFDQG